VVKRSARSAQHTHLDQRSAVIVTQSAMELWSEAQLNAFEKVGGR
jgi:hypothetical protein